MNAYSREDAKMTQGFAILCMLLLHLFCRAGSSVLGTPLIWISADKPLVYWFGFFSEICVPIYTICAGYARQLTVQAAYRDNLKRILKLLKNYWIVVLLFSTIGLAVGGAMPGSLIRFVRAVTLVEHYNGAQWYLNTYILLLLIPSRVLMFPVRKVKPKVGIAACVLLQVLWYFAGRLGFLPEAVNGAVPGFVYKELTNLIGVLPYYWMGAFLCKGKLVDECGAVLAKHFTGRKRNALLLSLGAALFVGFNLLNKSILVGVVSVGVFLIFNLMQKGNKGKAFFMFMGKHSTNIWLTHMFFYCSDPFNGLVQKAKYPVLLLLFMLVLCIATSYMILAINKLFDRVQKGILH